MVSTGFVSRRPSNSKPSLLPNLCIKESDIILLEVLEREEIVFLIIINLLYDTRTHREAKSRAVLGGAI